MSVVRGRTEVRRRWIISVGLVVSVVLAAIAAATASQSYRASEDVVYLVSPTSQNPGSAGKVLNPYLGFGDLKVIVKATSSLMSSDTTKALVKSQGASGDYSVALSGDLTSPIATVEATSPTSAGALKSYQVVLAQLQQATRRLQQEAGAPASTWITVEPVGTPTNTVSLATPKVKAGAYGLLAGLIATALAVFLSSLLGNRRVESVRPRYRGAAAGPGSAGRTAAAKVPTSVERDVQGDHRERPVSVDR